MKYKLFVTFFAVTIIFCFSACFRDVDVFVPRSAAPDYTLGELRSFLEAGTDTDTTFQGIYTGNGLAGAFYTKHGCKIRFMNTAAATATLTNFGGTACPTGTVVNIFVREIWKKGDMIRFQKPTISQSAPIESGGEILIEITNAATGEKYKLASGAKIEVIFPQFAAVQQPNGMKKYLGVGDTSDFNWLPVVFPMGTPNAGQQVPLLLDTWQDSNTTNAIVGWKMEIDSLEWHNCDRPLLNDPLVMSHKLDVKLNLPKFASSNTVCWVIYRNLNIGVYMYSNSTAQKFYADKTLSNQDVTLVTISKVNGEFYLGSQSVNTGPFDILYTVTPELRTETEIRTFLDGL